MNTKILDNKKTGRIAEALGKSIYAHSKLSVISAYFTIYAYRHLQKELAKIDEMRFLLTTPLNDTGAATHPFGGSRYEAALKNEMLQRAVAAECAQWIREKVQIRALRQPNAATPRLICVEGRENITMNGTVDLTAASLGAVPSPRLDLVTLIDDQEQTRRYLDIFNEIWNDDSLVEDVTQHVLQRIEALYRDNSPEFIYYLSLYHIFHDYLSELGAEDTLDPRTGIKQTRIWNMLYRFQKDGVIGLLDKIEKYNGCILADSVGLGKTFTALAVIKYYELRNDRVLVLCPKKLHENWSIYTQNDRRNILVDDRFHYDILHHTDLSRRTGYSGEINLETINWGNYDLVVIDESHNFRNNEPAQDRVTRYQRLMNDIIRDGVPTKVLMLSATPVNNRMNDLKNQIAFITEGDYTALADVGIRNIENTLQRAQTAYNRWSDLKEIDRTTDKFIEMMHPDYFKLLDTLTIARSRKHIEKYYNIAEIGKFPERRPPVNLYSHIDTRGTFPTIEAIYLRISQLKLAVYSPISYLLIEKKDHYAALYDKKVRGGAATFRQIDREQNLIGLMRVNMLKRLESSIQSFRLTIQKILAKINTAIERLDTVGEYNPDLDIGEIDPDDDLLAELAIGEKKPVLLQDIDKRKWRQDLQSDAAILTAILAKAEQITPDRDQKLADLCALIDAKIAHPTNNDNRKIIIFTAFADTAAYLYEHIAPRWAKKGIYTALVTGSGGNRTNLPLTKTQAQHIKTSDLGTVLTLFSPQAKDAAAIYGQLPGEIDILIATDCISEGQNLQDCDYLINYDIHWNPVRIIQRFGRIDRIGSPNQSIQLVNFWPIRDLDEYINLEQRVKGRFVLVDVSATGDENLIETGPNTPDNQETKALQFRKKQLERLRDEVIDIEDISGNISITDLSFSDFKTDLKNYLETHRTELETAPLGLFAVTDIPDTLRGELPPGAIFLLRHRDDDPPKRETNPIYPYFLTYITQTGEIRYHYLYAKQILDILRKTASGKDQILPELVAALREETNHYQDMSHYETQLRAVIENIIGQTQEEGLRRLFTKTPIHRTDNYTGNDQFELITWLIIKEAP